jgi:hypothetical protein
MSEIDRLREELRRARAAAASGRQAHLVAREAWLRARTRLGEAARTADPKDPEEARRLKAVEAEVARLEQAAGAAANGKSAAMKAVGQGLAELVKLGEPDRLAGTLDDRHPILLFPLRLETRWKRGPSERTGQVVDQLWLRVYPDDCQVETFTEILSESELRNVKAFWIAFWAAGGVEAQQRAAWRGLVNAHGAGRASWLVTRFVPGNPGDAPVKADPGDLLLVMAADAQLDAVAEAAARAFWKAWWLAGDDAAARAAAVAALRAAVGDARAAHIEDAVVPPNAADPPPAGKARAEVAVEALFVRFPADDSVPLSSSSWLQAPAVRTLPDRFLVLGFRKGQQVLRWPLVKPVAPELHVGPDPSLPDGQQMKPEGGELKLNDELRWMTDFGAAVDKGMATRIDVGAEDLAQGFDELLVLGLRYSSDAAGGAGELERLFTNHHFSSNGLSVLPQGTPTNNTEGVNAGYHSLDDADLAFDIVFRGKDAFAEEADERERRDGQWLAGGLGISPALLQKVPNAAGRDQLEARAMNTALWPATWGYYLEEMMAPLLPAADIAATRDFFTRFVSGRGALPAVRIGRQPYGILPATAFSRLAFSGRTAGYLDRLHGFLGQLDAQWELLKARVATVVGPGDPHQRLLDVIGLAPGSVEFHQRYAQSFDQMWNALVLKFGEPWGRILAASQAQARAAVLATAGLPAGSEAPILKKYFLGKASLLDGDLVDDLPLSETRPVRPYAPGKNYLAWLRDSSLETVRLQDFGGVPAPTALLYLWLRHALMLAYWDGGLRLYETAGVAMERKEPDFVHVKGAGPSESKWRPLYQAAPGTGNVMVAEYISRSDVIATKPELSELKAVKAALGRLEPTPTARLERLFAEHVDCCHYRLDAWKNGLVAARLWELREKEGRGVYLGAYGWLEGVRSEDKTFSAVRLSPELAEVFQKEGRPAPVRDESNAGFIHAPSIGQATAAAVLKSAHLSAPGPEAEGAYAIDLGSARVRKALALLEGIRNGQSLGALLGYQLERGLHDRYGLAEVDRFIFPLRMKFPLVADQLASTVAPEGTAIEVVEARNVLDGLKLLAHVRDNPGTSGYPFGFTDLPAASAAQAGAIDAEVAGLRDASDAVADLMLSESVYQMVQGNFDRAAAAAETLAKGGHPPDIEVVRTPRSGRALTHRFAIHFDTGVDPAASPEPGLTVSPRARAEAPVNHWLHAILPRPGDIGARVTVTHPGGTTAQLFVTPKQLGLQPIDLLMAAGFDSEPAMTDLDDRVWHHLWHTEDRHPLDDLKIEYMVPATAGGVSFFAAGALLRSLRVLLLKSRYLGPGQLAPGQEARAAVGDFDAAELEGRVGEAVTEMLTHLSDLNALATNTTDGISDYVEKVARRLLEVGRLGVPQTSPGLLFSEVKGIFQAVSAKLRAVIERWDQRVAAYDALGVELGAATTDEARLELLARMEAAVSPVATSPRPTVVAAYQAAVAGRRTALDLLHGRLRGHLTPATADLEAYLAAVLPDVQQLAAFDSVPFDRERQKNDLEAEAKRVTELRALAQRKVRLLADDLVDRGDRAAALIAEAAGQASTGERIELLLSAGKLALGDDFPLLPRFRVAAGQGAELALALGDTAQLLRHQRQVVGRRFPVDDWLYGVARVREKLFHFENAVFLAEALRNAAPAAPTPLQLPYRPQDSWLALELPAGHAIDSEKLLYTASFARPFDQAGLHAGLLVDEWTEVIPAGEEVTGIGFHYDQPSTEPPQVMMLLVPPRLEGAWKWEDIVGGVRETFEMARRRAVEPAHLDESPYAQFLPATLMAVTVHQVTIATNLAVNKGVYDDLARR